MSIRPFHVLAVALAIAGFAAGLMLAGPPSQAPAPGSEQNEPVADARNDIGAALAEPRPLAGGGEASIAGLLETHGAPLLVNFWATWCGPCRDEMPDLNRIAKALPPGGGSIVGVAVDDMAEVEAFLATLPLAYPSLVENADDGMHLSVLLGNRNNVLPYSVLFDAQGRVSFRRAGTVRHEELLTLFGLDAKPE